MKSFINICKTFNIDPNVAGELPATVINIPERNLVKTLTYKDIYCSSVKDPNYIYTFFTKFVYRHIPNIIEFMRLLYNYECYMTKRMPSKSVFNEFIQDMPLVEVIKGEKEDSPVKLRIYRNILLRNVCQSLMQMSAYTDSSYKKITTLFDNYMDTSLTDRGYEFIAKKSLNTKLSAKQILKSLLMYRDIDASAINNLPDLFAFMCKAFKKKENDILTSFSESVTPAKFELLWTPEEISDVYSGDGPTSCMTLTSLNQNTGKGGIFAQLCEKHAMPGSFYGYCPVTGLAVLRKGSKILSRAIIYKADYLTETGHSPGQILIGRVYHTANANRNEFRERVLNANIKPICDANYLLDDSTPEHSRTPKVLFKDPVTFDVPAIVIQFDDNTISRPILPIPYFDNYSGPMYGVYKEEENIVRITMGDRNIKSNLGNGGGSSGYMFCSDLHDKTCICCGRVYTRGLNVDDMFVHICSDSCGLMLGYHPCSQVDGVIVWKKEVPIIDTCNLSSGFTTLRSALTRGVRPVISDFILPEVAFEIEDPSTWPEFTFSSGGGDTMDIGGIQFRVVTAVYRKYIERNKNGLPSDRIEGFKCGVISIEVNKVKSMTVELQ